MADQADPCSVCAGRVERLYRWRGFDLVRCPACQTERAVSPPTARELAAFYQARNRPKMDRWPQRLARIRRAFGGYLRRIRSTGSERPRRFLDLGGGVGYYARAAMDHGLEACLVEWAEDAIAFARAELWVDDAITSDLVAFGDALAGRSFDYVLARHVIEHLHDPERLLDDMRGVVVPGGLVQIETPNVETREQLAHLGVVVANRRILRRDNPAWPAWACWRRAIAKSVSGVNPPKHLWGFSERGLRVLLARHGFDVLDVRRAIAGHRIYDPLYYDQHRLGRRRGWGIPYFAWQRTVSNLMRANGMNLVVLARRRGAPPTLAVAVAR